MKKRQIILVVLMLVLKTSFSQVEFSNIYSYKSSIEISSIPINDIRRDIKTCYNDDNVYLSLSELNSDTIIIDKYNLKQDLKTKIYCPLGKEVFLGLEVKEISRINCTENMVFIVFYKTLFTFTRVSDSIFTMTSKYTLLHHADDMFFFDGKNKIYYAAYNFTGNNISVLDLNTGFSSVKISPLLNIKVLASITPNQFCDINNKHILVSNSSIYDLKVYNTNFDLIQEIKIEKEGWNYIPNDLAKKMNSSNDIHKAFKYFFNSEVEISKINYVYFISENEFIVHYTLQISENKAFIDVWKYNPITKKFEIATENLNNFLLYQLPKERIISDTNLPIEFLSRSSSDILFFPKGMIIPVYKPILTFIGMSIKTYRKKYDEYLLKNNPTLQLFIYQRNISE
jgi:hypothetical protein